MVIFLVGSNNPFFCLNFRDHCIQIFFFIQNHLGWPTKDAGEEAEAVIFEMLNKLDQW